MLQRYALLFAGLLMYTGLSAQSISGTVYDKDNKVTVPGATVYLDNTSIYTTTGPDGSFLLKAGQQLNTRLIIQHMSYEMLIVEKPFGKSDGKYYLTEKENRLNEITIEGDKFTRAQKMKAFKEHFLGRTKAGKSCTIINENDVQLFYNIKNKTLTAKASAPITVHNEYLGYTISFNLIEFEVQFKIYSLKYDYMKNSFFAGTSLFTDEAAENKKLLNRRNEVYESSPICFFKHLVNNSLDSSQFVAFDQRRGRIIPSRFFHLSDTLSQKLIVINPEIFPYLEPQGISSYAKYKKIDIVYKKSTLSSVYFLRDSLVVDRNGLLNNLHDVSYSGDMGYKKLGDMLPLDYHGAAEE